MKDENLVNKKIKVGTRSNCAIQKRGKSIKGGFGVLWWRSCSSGGGGIRGRHDFSVCWQIKRCRWGRFRFKPRRRSTRFFRSEHRVEIATSGEGKCTRDRWPRNVCWWVWKERTNTLTRMGTESNGQFEIQHAHISSFWSFFLAYPELENYMVKMRKNRDMAVCNYLWWSSSFIDRAGWIRKCKQWSSILDGVRKGLSRFHSGRLIFQWGKLNRCGYFNYTLV